MGRSIKTIYESLSAYSEEEINNVIENLSKEEKKLIKARYGDDLHNPSRSGSYNQEKKNKFFKQLLPKMKNILEGKDEDLNNAIETAINEVIEEEKIEVQEANEIEEVKEKEEDLKTQVLNLVNKKRTNNEICDILKINRNTLQETLLELKNIGLAMQRKYYSNGDIKYKLVNTISDLIKANNYNNQDKVLITDGKENELKLLLMSDLHFGNELERKDLVDKAFNYAVANNIHTILTGGDLIDGAFSKGTRKITNLYDQIIYFIENYPYDKSILTFGVMGDHDASALTNSYLNFIESLNNYRHDVIIGGYNNSALNIKNDQILMHHHMPSGDMRKSSASIIFQGHPHQYTVKMSDNQLIITSPSLSDINQSLPTALELFITFKKGYINKAILKQIYLGEVPIILNEVTYNLEKDIESGIINNIEPYKEKMLTKQVTHLSQIDKFNKKYGITSK